MAASRSIFRFKQFQLAHGNPGLKISTEACLFGAWASQWAQGRMLDVGTGSGLLACMLAQKHPESLIDALEILPEVAMLATDNVLKSPFKKQISVHNGDLQHFSSEDPYDFIACNPPFFHQHLAADKKDLQVAIHDDLLTAQDLALGIHRLLGQQGQFAVIYPPFAMEKFMVVCSELGLHIYHKAYVFPRETSAVLRVMAIGSRDNSAQSHENLVIKQSDESYTEAFKKLLSDYYLQFPLH